MAINPELATAQTGRELKRIVYSEQEIQARVSEMAVEISEAYGPEDELLVLGLLKGSFIFLADLVRRIQRPLQVDFLVASSYGDGMKSSGMVNLLYDPEASLEERGPRRLEVCPPLHKRVAELDAEPRWVGFDAPQEFLVGYGLDYSENFRHLPFIGSL